MFDPYEALPALPRVEVTSDSFVDGDVLPLNQVGGLLGTGGQDKSPHLKWDKLPDETKSIAITCLDPDAPTGSGFWHLAVCNLPADLTYVSEGAFTPEGIHVEFDHAEPVVLRNDGGVRGYVGAAPPPGHGAHRYIFAVHALNVERLDVSENTSPGMLGFMLFQHAVARGRITGKFENPASN